VAAVVNPGGLAPGVYHGRVNLQAGAAAQTIPVSMIVSPGGGILDTDRSGVHFDDVAGGTRLQSSRPRVINRGPGTISWNAEVVEIAGGSWLTLGSPAGQSSGPDATGASELTLNASAAGLQAGIYHALVRVSSPEAPNSPRLATVVMNVRASGAQPAVAIEPAGLTFAAVQSAPAPPARTIELRSSQILSPPYRAAASTENGGNWLTVTPESGMLAADGRVTFNIGVATAGLTPGTYRGHAGFTTSDGVVRSAAVTLVVSTAGGGACTRSGLAIVPRAPVQNFQALTGAPVAVEVELIDEACGGTTSGASVLALSDVGDEVLALHASGAGRYAGTWTPRNAGSGANLRFIAKSGAFTASATVIGTITNSGLPVLNRGGAVNSASFGNGISLAPGSLFSVFGTGLAEGFVQAPTTPLPNELADLALVAGGREAPLLFASPGQANAQLPVEVPAGTTTQIVARAGQRLTSPVEASVADAGPGIFVESSAVGPFRARALNQDFSLNSVMNPAHAGEFIFVFFTGVGETDPLAATGQAAPLDAPSFGKLAAAATIGGQPATVSFAGLAPGFVGLAQANVLIPQGVATGPDVPIVIRIGGQISNSAVAAIAP
jgi:adhesin/invasin